MDYYEALNLACKAAGMPSPQWNNTFVKTLDELGFQIWPIAPRRWDDVMVPIPCVMGDQYPYPAIIVKKSD